MCTGRPGVIMTFGPRASLMLKLIERFGLLGILIGAAIYAVASTDFSPKTGVPASHSSENLPVSVLHYPSIEEIKKLGQERAVICHLNEKYRQLIADREKTLGAKLAFLAQMEKDELEIYVSADGTFFALVKGTDAAGQLEACEVAVGTGWRASQSPTPAPAAP